MRQWRLFLVGLLCGFLLSRGVLSPVTTKPLKRLSVADADNSSASCELELSRLRHDARRGVLETRIEALEAALGVESRASFALAYVIPFHEGHVARVLELLEVHWTRFAPCDVAAHGALNVHLVFFANRIVGDSAYAHEHTRQRLLRALAAANGADRCFASAQLLVANFSLRDDPGTYTRRGVAAHFFRAFSLPALQARFRYMAYMESDTYPVRAHWLERLARAVRSRVRHEGDFYVLGSLYRGERAPHEYCYALCGCAEHMNGNAVYRLGDDAFDEFLRHVHRSMDFRSYNYDAFIMNRLKDAQNWRFYQAHAHRFVYTELIQHGQELGDGFLERFPKTVLLHQGRFE